MDSDFARAVNAAMRLLAADERTVFVGQSVRLISRNISTSGAACVSLFR